MRKKKFKEPEIDASPDGSLISEHTRITLLPARLTVTDSGQVSRPLVNHIFYQKLSGSAALFASPACYGGKNHSGVFKTLNCKCPEEQVLVSGVETDEERRNPGTIAQQSVQPSRKTHAHA